VNDQQLRALVRDAVARHLGGAASPAGAGPAAATPPAFMPAAPPAAPAPSRVAPHDHPGHAMYLALVNVGDACLIEPAVACNHCGYCKTHGY
jgi:hypothetical protein